MTTSKRIWKELDVDGFRRGLKQSSLLTDPPDDVTAFIDAYDQTLRSLVEKRVPTKLVKTRRRPSSPWFNHRYSMVKVVTRRLERRYRSSHLDSDFRLWRNQFTLQRRTFQEEYATYWSSVI